MFLKLASKHKFIRKLYDKKRAYSVFEAIDLIRELEIQCSNVNIAVPLHVTIYQNDQPVLGDKIILGNGEGVHYLVYLENKLSTLSLQVTSEEKVGFDESLRIVREMKKMYINQHNRTNAHEQNAEQIESSPKDSHAMTNQKKGYTPKKMAPTFDVNKKLVWIGSSVIGVLLVAGGIFWFFQSAASQGTRLDSNVEPETVVVSEPMSRPRIALADYIQAKKFAEALTEYPEEFPKIERSIFYLGVEGIPYLEEFLKVKQYPKGEFDLAYLKKDFAKVIALKQEADSDDRLAQLAVAYIKQENLAEAEKLNESLKSDAIAKLLFVTKENMTVSLIKAWRFDEARQLQTQINSEKVKVFFEQYDALQKIISDAKTELEKADVTEETKKQQEEIKSKAEADVNTLINSIS